MGANDVVINIKTNTQGAITNLKNFQTEWVQLASKVDLAMMAGRAVFDVLEAVYKAAKAGAIGDAAREFAEFEENMSAVRQEGQSLLTKMLLPLIEGYNNLVESTDNATNSYERHAILTGQITNAELARRVEVTRTTEEVAALIKESESYDRALLTVADSTAFAQQTQDAYWRTVDILALSLDSAATEAEEMADAFSGRLKPSIDAVEATARAAALASDSLRDSLKRLDDTNVNITTNLENYAAQLRDHATPEMLLAEQAADNLLQAWEGGLIPTEAAASAMDELAGAIEDGIPIADTWAGAYAGIGGAADIAAEKSGELRDQLSQIEAAALAAAGTYDIVFNISVNGSIPDIASGTTKTGGGKEARTGFASGADFVVPPGFPSDSFGPIFVQSGEHVKVTPAGEVPASAAPPVVIVTLDGEQIAAHTQVLQGRDLRMALSGGAGQTGI